MFVGNQVQNSTYGDVCSYSIEPLEGYSLPDDSSIEVKFTTIQGVIVYITTGSSLKTSTPVHKSIETDQTYYFYISNSNYVYLTLVPVTNITQYS